MTAPHRLVCRKHVTQVRLDVQEPTRVVRQLHIQYLVAALSGPRPLHEAACVPDAHRVDFVALTLQQCVPLVCIQQRAHWIERVVHQKHRVEASSRFYVVKCHLRKKDNVVRGAYALTHYIAWLEVFNARTIAMFVVHAYANYHLQWVWGQQDEEVEHWIWAPGTERPFFRRVR